MKWLKKNMVLMVVVFLIMGVCIWIIRQPKQEGFTETPIVEITKIMYGKTGDDMKSILERYFSTSETPQAIQLIQSVLADIDVIHKGVDNIKNKCENSSCDNIEMSEFETLLPVAKKLLSDIKQITENHQCNISEPDKIQLLENIEAINPFIGE